MRQTALDQIYELATKDKRVVFIGSDLGAGTMENFRREMPERFFMEGISEQHLVGMAAGMALSGFIVYVHTIATFLTRRCFEQLVLDVGYHNANVRLIASGGGLVYAPLGATHLAIDDFAIMRAIPNMTVIAPADAEEMKRLMPCTVDHNGPIYIRLAKGGDPIVTRDEPFGIGKIYEIRKGKNVSIFSTGVLLSAALQAAQQLKEKKISAAVFHVPTIKPFDLVAMKKEVSGKNVVVTIEEHTLMGGFGSAVAEIVAEMDETKRPKHFVRIGLPDVFPSGFGSQRDLLKKYGITEGRIVEEVLGAMRR